MSSQARISLFMSSVDLCPLPVSPISEWLCQCYSTGLLWKQSSLFSTWVWIQWVSVIAIVLTSVLDLFIRVSASTSVIQTSASAIRVSVRVLSASLLIQGLLSCQIMWRFQCFRVQPILVIISQSSAAQWFQRPTISYCPSSCPQHYWAWYSVSFWTYVELSHSYSSSVLVTDILASISISPVIQASLASLIWDSVFAHSITIQFCHSHLSFSLGLVHLSFSFFGLNHSDLGPKISCFSFSLSYTSFIRASASASAIWASVLTVVWASVSAAIRVGLLQLSFKIGFIHLCSRSNLSLSCKHGALSQQAVRSISHSEHILKHRVQP